MKMQKTEIRRVWAMRIGGGPLPYLAWDVCCRTKEEAQKQCTYPFHRPVRAVLIPLGEYRRLLRESKKAKKG